MVLEDVLLRTPGLMERDIAAFMGRWVQLLQNRRSEKEYLEGSRAGGNLLAN